MFHEIRLPTDISFGSSGGPEFSTDIVITHGGYEQRNLNWVNTKAKYNIAQAVRKQGQLDILIAFFRARQGKAHAFRFKDWTDYKSEGQQIAIADGVQGSFQLIKKYNSGGVTYNRAITKPVDTSVAVYVDGILENSTIVDYTTGQVSFIAPPPAGTVITADFEFDVPVRFDTDHLPTTLNTYGSNSILDVPLVEVRV